jgi:5-formyltetrahydrofolate cyclo-ligase
VSDPSLTSASGKRELRRVMRARRRRLSPAQQRRAADQVARRLAQRPWFSNARSVACYIAADGEIDPLPLLHRALAAGKRVYLPVLERGARLRFAEYRNGARMRRNRFGIPEPTGRRHCRPQQLDLVLLPLVAFDRRGARLGMGGGFYDRTFAFLRAGGRRKPRLLGLAHHFQEVAQLPLEPWDVPLAAIVTERGWVSV